jgi:hypothetical protein
MARERDPRREGQDPEAEATQGAEEEGEALSSNPNLLALAAAIAGNTLNAVQQGALLTALAELTPTFPNPDETSTVDSEADAAAAREWIAALYSIQSIGGAPVPPSVTDVTATLPITSTVVGTTRNIAINAATPLLPGSLSAADKAKLDSLPTGGVASVPNGAALTALPNAAFPDGALAFVSTYGAYFAQRPAGPALTPDTILAANDGRVWERYASGIAAAWLAQTDVFWDPQAGSNENTGVAIGSPLKTFSEIVRRYGTVTPILPYGQSITVHQLTAQTANTDAVFFQPHLSGGGQAILLATLVQLQAPFAGGAVTAKVIGAPGTRLQVAAMPAGVAANQLVFNSTRNSYAFVDSMAVAVATMQQPIAAAGLTTPNVPAPVEDNTWATGDTLTVFDCPLLNLSLWSPLSADENVGATKASVGWVQFARIADSTGVNGSVYGHYSRCVANVLSACRVDCRINLSGQNGRGSQTYLIGCTVKGLCQPESGFSQLFGGGFASGVQATGSACVLAGDVTLHGLTAAASGAVLQITAAFSDGTMACANGSGCVSLNAANALWGSVAITVNGGCAFLNNSLGTWANALKTSGGLNLGLLNTGTAAANGGTFTLNGVTPVNVAGVFPANAAISWALKTVGATPGLSSPFFSAATVANQFTVQSQTALANDVYDWQAQPTPLVPITPANLDLYGGLTSPAIGAKYANAA